MGFIRSKVAVTTLLLAVWFSVTFLIPGFIKTVVEKNAVDSTSDYRTEIEKLKIIADFEKRSAKEYGGQYNGSKMELARKIIEGYWNDDYKKIEVLEEELKNEISENIDRYRKMAIFTPVTFYQLTGNEVSSRGYENFLEFYAYLQEMKRKFLRFFLDRVYYNDPKELVSFIKGDENVFYAKSKLPKSFGTGVWINLLYIIILLGAAYLRFKTYLFDVKDKKYTALTNLKLEIKRTENTVVFTEDDNLKNQIFSVLNGMGRGFTGKIMLDDSDLLAAEKKEKSAYVCKPGDIPSDIKTGALVNLFTRSFKTLKSDRAKLYLKLKLETIEKKYFNELDIVDKTKVLFNITRLTKSQIYIVNDFANSMPFRGIYQTSEELKKLKANKMAIIYITLDSLLAEKIGESGTYLKSDPTIPNYVDDYEL